MMEMKRKRWSLNINFWNPVILGHVQIVEIFVVKTLVLISFFVFRFILEDTEGKEDTKMEDDEEDVNEKNEEDA